MPNQAKACLAEQAQIIFTTDTVLEEGDPEAVRMKGACADRVIGQARRQTPA